MRWQRKKMTDHQNHTEHGSYLSPSFPFLAWSLGQFAQNFSLLKPELSNSDPTTFKLHGTTCLEGKKPCRYFCCCVCLNIQSPMVLYQLHRARDTVSDVFPMWYVVPLPSALYSRFWGTGLHSHTHRSKHKASAEVFIFLSLSLVCMWWVCDYMCTYLCACVNVGIGVVV